MEQSDLIQVCGIGTHMNHLNQLILKKLNHKYSMSQSPLNVTELLKLCVLAEIHSHRAGHQRFTIAVQYSMLHSLHRVTLSLKTTSLCFSLQKSGGLGASFFPLWNN